MAGSGSGDGGAGGGSLALGMSSGVASASSVTSSHLLSWQAVLPPRAMWVVAIDFAKPLRHVDLAPADASRGLDVGPAALMAVAIAEGGAVAPSEAGPQAPMILFTETVLVPVPIADASMPFNVAAVSSTLVALFVGLMFNSLIAHRGAICRASRVSF